MRVALQLYTIRDDMAKDFKGTLQRVKNMGYEGVEFAGLFGYAASEVKSMLQEIGLQPVSAHVSIDELLADIDKVIEDYNTIGCRYIAIPWLGEERRPGNAGFEQTIKDIFEIGEKANKQGLKLLYHNHDFEFAEVDGEYALDILYKKIPAHLLETELDTCWVNVAGQDPAMYIRKYSGRAPVVHLKDFVMPGKKPDQLHELTGAAQAEQNGQVDAFEFRPVGHGYQNFPAILEAAVGAGTEWVIVELDRPGMNKSPMECAEMSIDYLKTLNF